MHQIWLGQIWCKDVQTRSVIRGKDEVCQPHLPANVHFNRLIVCTFLLLSKFGTNLFLPVWKGRIILCLFVLFCCLFVVPLWDFCLSESDSKFIGILRVFCRGDFHNIHVMSFIFIFLSKFLSWLNTCRLRLLWKLH